MLLVTVAWSTRPSGPSSQKASQKDPRTDQVRLHGPGPRAFQDFMQKLTQKTSFCVATRKEGLERGMCVVAAE